MDKLTVIKVGGKIVEEHDTLQQLLDDFAKIGGYKVLTHGGGRSATRLATRLGIESRMVNGRRITDAETLQVVTMVYGGIYKGVVPVMAPLTHDGQGSLLNTNADTIAGETAKALARRFDVTLVYCFEKPGVLRDENDDSSLIPEITPELFDRLVADGTVQGGMIPKLENSFDALKAGVSEVVITQASAIGRQTGTRIRLQF